MFPTRKITTMGGDKFKDEYSLDFDGSNDYIVIGNPADLQFGTASITFTFWVKQDSGDGGYLISKRDTDNGQFSVYVESDGQHRMYNGTNTMTNSNFGTAWDFGVWNHLAMVYDHSAGTVSKYLNGTLDIVDTSLNTPANVDDNQAWRISGRFTAGDAMTGTSDSFEGKMSEVTIYNKALSASEIATVYNSREPYNHKEGVCSSNLKAWWRMGDGTERGSGTTIYDMSNSSNNGTMTNMAANDFTGDTP